MLDTTPPRERLVRVSEAARILSVHPDTVRRWTELHLIRHYRLGPRRDRLFDREDLTEYLATHRRESSA